MAKKQNGKSMDLGQLQTATENATSRLKAAGTALANAKQAYDKAQEAYSVAQKALASGVETVKAATRVG